MVDGIHNPEFAPLLVMIGISFAYGMHHAALGIFGRGAHQRLNLLITTWCAVGALAQSGRLVQVIAEAVPTASLAFFSQVSAVMLLMPTLIAVGLALTNQRWSDAHPAVRIYLIVSLTLSVLVWTPLSPLGAYEVAPRTLGWPVYATFLGVKNPQGMLLILGLILSGYGLLVHTLRRGTLDPVDRRMFLATFTAYVVVGSGDMLDGLRWISVPSTFAYAFGVGSVALSSLASRKLLRLERTLAEQLDTLDTQNRDLQAARIRAEEANQARSRFIANVSHELRTPLNGVLGAAQLLDASEMDAAQRDLLDIVTTSGNLLRGLIEDVLDASRLESGELDLVQESFDLEQVLEEVLQCYATEAHSKGVVLEARISPELPVGLVGDAKRVGQVLHNLLSNAVKFTEHGSVRVDVRAMTDRDATLLWIDVIDTGIGIRADRLPKLFGRFSQVDDSATRRFGGAGLGLSITRDLIRAMGGDITVTSSPRQGSVFHVELSLPVVSPPAATTAATDAHVIVVDPEGSLAWAIGPELSRQGLVWRRATSKRDLGSPTTPTLVLDAVPDQPMPEHRHLLRVALLQGDEPVVGKAQATARRPLTRSRLTRALDALSAQPDAEDTLPVLEVLVVDDNAVNLRIAERMLQRLGQRVTLAHGGAEAVELCAGRNFGLVLMDCQMPEVDGFEASRQILDQSVEHVPIYALTASAMPSDREKAASAGMVGFLSKPVRLEVLQATLLELQGTAARSDHLVAGR